MLGMKCNGQFGRGLCVSVAAVAATSVGVWGAEDGCAPALVGSIAVPWSAWDVEVADGIAYVAGLGLTTVNISDPSDPVELGSVQVPLMTSDLAIMDGYAYIADYLPAMMYTVVDVRDPRNPVVVGTPATLRRHARMEADAGVLYLAGTATAWQGLQVFGLTSPADFELLSSHDTFAQSGDIALSGDLAYVTLSDNASPFLGLEIIDVTDGLAPATVGLIETASAGTIALGGGYACIGYYPGIGPFQVVDVSNPMDPSPRGVLDVACQVRQVVGSIAFAVNESAGLVMIDIADPDQPELLAVVDTPWGAEDVEVVGRHAYVADTNELLIFDLRSCLSCTLADVAPPYGVLNIDDVLAYLGAFAAGDPLADVAPPSGTLDIDDVLTFLDAFAGGCP